MSPCLANFVFLVEIGFLRVGQAGLELLTSGNPPTLVSQSVGITGVSPCTQPQGSCWSVCTYQGQLPAEELPHTPTTGQELEGLVKIL